MRRREVRQRVKGRQWKQAGNVAGARKMGWRPAMRRPKRAKCKKSNPKARRQPKEQMEEPKPIGGKGEGLTDSRGQRLTDSGGQQPFFLFVTPPRVEYLDDPSQWKRDPRLGPGETARMKGWRSCECNGFCRHGCPGRRRHPSYGKPGVIREGCPNPAAPTHGEKWRCSACQCQVEGCDEACYSNRKGFCSKHRPVVCKRPAAAVQKRPAAQT